MALRNRESLEPATEETHAIVNAMREDGVLVGIEGRVRQTPQDPAAAGLQPSQCGPTHRSARPSTRIDRIGSIRGNPRLELPGCFSTHGVRNFADSVTRFL
jgi:hypothetical protein